MRSKLIIALLLVVMALSVCGCSQSASNTPAEAEVTEAVEESISDADNAHEEELPVEEHEAPAQEQAITEESPFEEDAAETIPEESHEEATDAENYENSEVYKEFMEMMEALGECPVQVDEPTPPASETEPYYEEPVELPVRTHEEARAVVTEIADNFKASSAFNNVTDFGMQYLDKNLETLKTNPESDDSIKLYIEYYKNGSMSEEKFTYMIESWLRSGGSFGDAKVSVQ